MHLYTNLDPHVAQTTLEKSMKDPQSVIVHELNPWDWADAVGHFAFVDHLAKRLKLKGNVTLASSWRNLAKPTHVFDTFNFVHLSDWIRYAIIAVHGGVFTDIDIFHVTESDHVGFTLSWSNQDGMYQPNTEFGWQLTHRVNQGMLMTGKRDPLILHVLQTLDEVFSNPETAKIADESFDFMGPKLFAKIREDNPELYRHILLAHPYFFTPDRQPNRVTTDIDGAAMLNIQLLYSSQVHLVRTMAGAMQSVDNPVHLLHVLRERSGSDWPIKPCRVS